MTDAALRELERRWRASGDDAAWLVARARAGLALLVTQHDGRADRVALPS